MHIIDEKKFRAWMFLQSLLLDSAYGRRNKRK